ncbi:hypothetical protein CTAYLR_008362 [Chrysophaeum taylorii]|uniref:Serine aminopeptidase S33 domain-containing protein n=1 Tax=Chrysophaeum taylorii TaxID=2483200 RepID=A0AAD7UMM2_9STRA|nr:hypothetical protein CTAYLR_008362 [Chrysophaeum taylorii]
MDPPGEEDEEDGAWEPSNPRPGWEWPKMRTEVVQISTDLIGIAREAPLSVRLEFNYLRWRRHERRGRYDLSQVRIHGDVKTLHGEATPVLDLELPGKKPIVLKFVSLDVMNDWWCKMLHAQQLVRQMNLEQGVPDEEEEEEDDDDDALIRKGANERHANLARGMFEPAVFLAIRRAYEQVLALIIRPPRAKYAIEKLGPPKFRFGKKIIVRDDFFVVNARGLRVMASLWRPAADEWRFHVSGSLGAAMDDALAGLFGPSEPHLQGIPTVIYSHGNASCRLEALSVLTSCLGLGCAVCALDCSGSGHSDGDYVSLGYYESDDVVSVVTYLKDSYGLNKYALWGRSMGAVTSLLYASEKAPDALAIVADSPFSSIKRLCHDLVHKVTKNVPSGAILLAVRKIRRSVKYRTRFDIYKCNPGLRVASAHSPAVIVHGADDDFIFPQHSDDIANTYGGDCEVLKPKGNHNAKRPVDVFVSIQSFLATRFSPDDPLASVVDVSNFEHPGIPNPYLLPPWAFRPKLGTSKVEVDLNLFKQKKNAVPPKPDRQNDEFVSGMSDHRQQQTEGAIGNLFGAAPPTNNNNNNI